MKYAYILVAALFTAALSSCCAPCPSGKVRHTCSLSLESESRCAKAEEPPCSTPSGATKPAPAPVVAKAPDKPDAGCGDSCTKDRCACADKPCACAAPKPKPAPVVVKPKVAPKPAPVVAKPKPAPKVVKPAPKVAKPAPKPRAAPAPAPEVTVTDRTYYWEFSNPQQRKVLPPGSDPYAQGFLPNPQDRGWVKEREYRLPPGTPVPGVR